MKLKTVAFHTLGCKLNFAETSTLLKQVEAAGFIREEFSHPADIYVINTCSVTENADKECKQLIRRVKRQNPNSKVVIIGCYAQLKPEEIIALDGVDVVLGAKEKFNLVQHLKDLEQQNTPQAHACEISAADFFVSSYAIGERTRAFLKVQDGCDYKCSYCTIPKARGISRSDTLENILHQAKEIAAQGIKEIVLTGVNIGDYGKGEFGNKKHEHSFLDLIQALDEVDNIQRIRISSIEPNLLSNAIIEFVAQSKKFVPHFHIPLQSGSNEILKKMRRRYLRELYANRVQFIKQLMPDACIGVDVIVGFPGETHAHFLETFQFIQDLEVSYLHVFTYSEREQTEAAYFPGVVPMSERKKRNAMLKNLSEKKKHAFYLSQLGKKKQVLWEEEIKDGKRFGYTENYIRVSAPAELVKPNTITPLVLETFDAAGNYHYTSPASTFVLA